MAYFPQKVILQSTALRKEISRIPKTVHCRKEAGGEAKADVRIPPNLLLKTPSPEPQLFPFPFRLLRWNFSLSLKFSIFTQLRRRQKEH